MARLVLLLQVLLVASWCRALWAYRSEGLDLFRRGTIVSPGQSARGATWLLAWSCLAFPVRWWFVAGINDVQSDGELIGWASLHVFAIVASQALIAAVRNVR